MRNAIDPLLEALQARLIEAASDDIARTVEEARREALAECKALLKEQVFRGVFEYARTVPVTPAAGSSPAGGSGATAGAAYRAAPAYTASPSFPTAVDARDARPAADTVAEGPAPDAALPADTVFEPVRPDDLSWDEEPASAESEEAVREEPEAAGPEVQEAAVRDEAAALADEVATLEAQASALEASTQELDEADLDPEILEEIAAIRQQISRNEQLLGQLKPFFSGQEGGHA
ncbi:MAG: hypothetical protein D6685_08530 [Bacteroidetes bacterium]|nr:MAG: hypothetical protein D6685_08530 [Bacteroidota bacterium]